MQAGSSNTAAAAQTLRACNTSGCRVSKFVEVTKRKCAQFVSAPYIMPKPLVVNGKTSIFQVGGEMAKMGDIPSLSAATGGGDGQTIYRIKPGTHAHVINYVFIDEGSESMEKAKSEDQEAMRMLLDSQRDSAAAKLQKLLSTHLGVVGATTAESAATTDSAPVAAPAATSTASAAAPASTHATPAVGPLPNSVTVTTPQIHPNLSIASVAGALPFATDNTLAPAATQAAPIPAPALAEDPIPSPSSNPVLDNSLDKLQAEILELRRTVALLGGPSQ